MGSWYMSICYKIFYNFCAFQIFNFLKKRNIRGREEVEEEEATGEMNSFVLQPTFFSIYPLDLVG